ncbi:HMG-box, partial [Lactarius tabidus]
LLASLGSVAQQMRHCANVADQFAQTLSQASFTGNSLHSLVPLDMVQVGNGHKRQGTEEDDIEGPTKKRRVSTKKLKDPDAPKRAASSYIFFQNDLRQELRKQHPGISSADIMTRVSKQWAEMTREQKAPYERLQAEAKQKWETEKRAYEERRGIVPTTKRAGHKVVATPVEEPVHRNGSPVGAVLV